MALDGLHVAFADNTATRTIAADFTGILGFSRYKV